MGHQATNGAEASAAIMDLLAKGVRPRRILFPESLAEEIRAALTLTAGGFRRSEVPLHVLGIPYYFEGTELLVEHSSNR